MSRRGHLRADSDGHPLSNLRDESGVSTGSLSARDQQHQHICGTDLASRLRVRLYSRRRTLRTRRMRCCASARLRYGSCVSTACDSSAAPAIEHLRTSAGRISRPDCIGRPAGPWCVGGGDVAERLSTSSGRISRLDICATHLSNARGCHATDCAAIPMIERLRFEGKFPLLGGSVMQWSYIKYENGRSHMVSNDLLTAVRGAMECETPPGIIRDIEISREICLEQGGMCITTRPLEEFVLCDLAICVPSEDLADLTSQWRSASAVMSLGQTFYRFNSWPWKCLVVDPQQRGDLLALFDARLDIAEHRAMKFYADRKSPQETLRKYNEGRGVVIPYGPDKIDRLKT